MKRNKLMVLVHVLMFSGFSFPYLSFADQGDPNPNHQQEMEDVARVGSAAGFDKRLPPVIPGENIQHNGRTTKVWSTSGPVPVGQVAVPPNAPQAPSNGQTSAGLPNVGVIVDQRSRAESNK